jgi:hypothetical protein
MCDVLLPPGVNRMCDVLLPPGVNIIAVKYIDALSGRVLSCLQMQQSYVLCQYGDIGAGSVEFQER